MRRAFLELLSAALLLGGVHGAKAESVDLQLILTSDVSRSIDNDEFKLEREGYAAALENPQVLNAIRSGPRGAIAVSFVEWSSVGEQKVVVDWSVIRDGEGAAVVAAQIRAAPRSFVGHTSISDGLDFAAKRFEGSGMSSPRRVIDVAGDGTNNSGRPISDARDDAVAKGIVVNGLAIINLNPNFGFIAHTQPPGGLPAYYRENVVGGTGSFVLQIDDFESFADAMVQKLVTEISGLPLRKVGRLARGTASVTSPN
ncbi:MAG TPA: DUF1194 domain-containing protein [Stellaceae bacterium]|nr:DUF1194 domain-containing protein [Stellaceae bacterium]